MIKEHQAPNARTAATLSVLKCTQNKAFSNIEITNTLDKSSFSKADAALYTLLTHGTLERLPLIDSFIDRLADGGIGKVDEKTKATLRVGIYQLLYTDRIPQSAACDETVKVAGFLGLKSGGFVNAVMRRAAVESKKFIENIKTLPEHIRYCVSESLLLLLKKQYPDSYNKVLESSFEPSHLPLRVNTLKTTVSDIKKLIPDSKEMEYSTYGLYWRGAATEILEELGDKIFIQGEGSQYAVSLLAPKEGQTVVDVCACPGGKSLSAAIEMKNMGSVVALDLHANKLGLITKSAERLGVDIITTAQNDARHIIPELKGKADKVICDVPCSGLGELSSKPEIRYKETESFEKLPQIQFEILCESVNYLKDGGKLVYSTCTVNKEENEKVVRRFISSVDGFSIGKEKTFFEPSEGFYACEIIKA